MNISTCICTNWEPAADFIYLFIVTSKEKSLEAD